MIALPCEDELAMAFTALDSARPDFGDDPLSISVSAAQSKHLFTFSYESFMFLSTSSRIAISDTGPSLLNKIGGWDYLCRFSFEPQPLPSSASLH